MKAVVFLTLAFLTAGLDAVQGTEPAGAGTGPARHAEIEIVDVEGCPVRVLPKKTRAGAGVDPSPWREQRGEGAPPPGTFPPDQPAEAPVVFHLVFQNRSEQEVDVAAFVWEALDERGTTLYRRISVYPGDPIGAGRIESIHELDLEPKGPATARYRVSPFKVVLSDGSIWEPSAPSRP